MLQDKETEIFYNKRTWLNSNKTPSTGSVVAFHGRAKYPEDKEPFENMFLEVSDCHVKARLHKTIFETREEFINKLRVLKHQIEQFIEHLGGKSSLDYIEMFMSLPHIDDKFQPIDDWGYIPNLYHFDGQWHVSWIHHDDGENLLSYSASTPEEAIRLAVEGYKSKIK